MLVVVDHFCCCIGKGPRVDSDMEVMDGSLIYVEDLNDAHTGSGRLECWNPMLGDVCMRIDARIRDGVRL